MKALKKNPHTGSDFNDFLESEGLDADVSARAAKRTFVHQLEMQLTKTKSNKNKIRKLLGSPTTTSRVFDQDYISLSLDTMARAATALGCDLKVALVPRKLVK
jgi:outer membrane protein assembly factor BamE (lipoprotein component of BamABCDE complex)